LLAAAVQLQQLQELLAASAEGSQLLQKRRQEVVARAWRTVEAERRALLKKGEVARALEQFEPTYAAWTPVAASVGQQKALAQARRYGALDIVEAQAAVATKRMPADPLGTAAALRQLDRDLPANLDFPETRALLKDRRGKVVDTALAEARKQRDKRAADKDPAGLLRLSEQVAAAWEKEAGAVSREPELASFRAACALANVKLRIARAKEDSTAPPLKVSGRLRQIAREVEEQAGLNYPAAQLLLQEERQGTARRGLTAELQEVGRLVKQGKYPAAVEAVKRTTAAWKEEAAAVKLEKELQAHREVAAAAIVASQLAAVEKGETEALKAREKVRRLQKEFPKELECAAVRQHFRDSRRRIVRSGLLAAGRERDAANKGKSLAALPAVLEPLLERVLRDWGGDAADLGVAELAAFQKQCALDIVRGRAVQAKEGSPADPLSVSVRLRKLAAGLPKSLDLPETRALLKDCRTRAVRDGLTGADSEREGFVKKKKYADVEKLKARTTEVWAAEVKALGLEAELTAFHSRCALALARPQVLEAEGLLAKSPLKASLRFRELASKLPNEPAFEEVRKLLERNRRKALGFALAAARKEYAARQAADDYAAMGALAGRLEKDWAAEARAVGMEGELRKLCQSLWFLSELAAPIQKGKTKRP
jgi:hypothetical protein